MLFFMIAVAAAAFAEQQPQTDASAQSAQNADNSGQAAVTLVVGIDKARRLQPRISRLFLLIKAIRTRTSAPRK